MFPHHENEIAQSRAACCGGDQDEGQDRFARFWLHNGFVKINDEKMYAPLLHWIALFSPQNRAGQIFVGVTHPGAWMAFYCTLAWCQSHRMIGHAT